MSYYSNCGNVCPGPIEGNALEGLNSRVAISVKRVLDSCCKKISMEHTLLNLTDIPVSATPPFRFIRATSVQPDANMRNLQVSRLENCSCFARIACNITVPVNVVFQDVNNNEFTATSQFLVAEDIVMYTPEASVFPFEISAAESCNCVTGEFIDNTTVDCTACLTIITKVVAETDLLVPTYGYCPSPKATDFETQACNNFFDLPLYPSGK